MRKTTPRFFTSLVLILFLSVAPSPILAQDSIQSPIVTPDQREYLNGVYRDTWNFLADNVEPITGLPYDASNHQPPTSITNIGLYLAATSIAYRTGLIPAADAEKRVREALDSLEKIERWRGIPRPWVIIRTLKPTFGEEFSYGPHLSALIAGLLVTQSSFPEITFEGIATRIRSFLQQMELKSLYDAKTGWLKGGYNVDKKDFAVYQSWGHWYYKYFASEIRALSYYMIVRGLAPSEHWTRLNRPIQQLENETFYISGYEEGGLYVQFLSGLFLDERKTEMGASQRGYVRAQIKHAASIGAPVWGWSSCMTPQGRYLAYGELRDDIVAPYASMLASMYFPEEAVQNLKRLEELGARPKEHDRFGEVDYGFLDSVSWQTGDTARHYLTPNQAMGFLALANLLYDGVVWKSFEESLPGKIERDQVEKLR